MISYHFAPIKNFTNSNFGLEDKNSAYIFVDYFIIIAGVISGDHKNYSMQNVTI